MLKINRLLAIIALFFFIVSMGSCGGGGGGNGSTVSPAPSEPTPPPPQTSTTDESGRVTLLTSQGQAVTFEIQDKDTGESLPDINLTFIEAQNYKIMAIIDDPSEKYVKTIYLDELAPYSPSKSNTGVIIQAVPIGVLIVLGITAVTGAIEWGFAQKDLGKAIKEVDAQIKSDFSSIGTSAIGVCYSPEQAAKFLWKTQAEWVAGTKSVISFLPGPGMKLAVFEIVKDELLKYGVTEIGEWIAKHWYETHVVDVSGNKMMAIIINSNTTAEEVVYKESYTVSYKDDAERMCKEILPPLPPSNLSAKVEEYNVLKWIKLTWDDNSPNEAGFEIERSLNGLDWKPFGTTNTNETIFSDPYVAGWQTYYYKVRAYGYNGQKSAFSWPAQVTIYSDYNLNPVISSVIAEPLFVGAGGTSTVTCNASDPNGDALTYLWTKTGGSIPNPSSKVTTWTAPSTAGTYTVTCTVSDGEATASKGVNITVSESTTPPSIVTTSLPSGSVNVSYATNLSATGGKTPYYWSIVNGGLPPGLSLSAAGIISGTPTTAGTYNFTVQVRDSSSPQQSASKALSIVVNPANTPTVTSVEPQSGVQGQTLNVTITGTNFTGATSVSFGTGITVNSFTVNSSTQITANISISSTAITGSRNVSVTTPAGTGTGNGLFTVTEPTTLLSITTTSLPSGTVNVTYGANLSATGGKTPYTWSWSGNTPPGLSLSAAGIISGTPTTAGTYNFTVQVRDSSSPQQSASKALSIVVNPANTPTVTSVEPQSGVQGQTLNVTITGTNFTGATSVSFGTGITVNSFTVNSSTQITANISISLTALTGLRNVSVTSPAGTGTGNGLFTVTTTALSFTNLTPSTITTSTAPYDATLSASGTNFNNVNRVTFNWSGAVSGSATWDRGDANWNAKVTVNSDSSMTLRPRVVETNPTWSGTVNWTVTLRDTTGATASRSFTVIYTPTTPARIDSYSPSSKITVIRGTPFTITVWFTNTGDAAAYFYPGVTIWDSNGNPVFDNYGAKTYLGKGTQTSYSWTPTINTVGEYWLQFGVWDEAKSKLLDKKPSPSQNLIKVVEPTPTVSASINSYYPNDPNNPVQVQVGNSTTISVTFTNTGNTPWSFIAGATVWDSNGNVVGNYSKTLSSPLQPGQQTTVSWSHTVNNTGDYWLQFGIWKGTPFTAENLLDKKPSPSQRLIRGVMAGKEVTVANTGGYGLRLRSCAALSCSTITTLPEGTKMSVIGGPVQADGYTWWNITGSPGTGWSAVGEWLTPITPQLNTTVTVTYTGGYGLRLRSCAALSCSIITTLPEGTQMKVFSGPVQADGYTWWALQGYVGGTLYTGWSAVGNWLVPNPRY